MGGGSKLMPLLDKVQDVHEKKKDHESQCMQQKRQLPGMMTQGQCCQVMDSTMSR